MLFNAKYPDKANAQKLYPDKLMGPHPEIHLTETLTQSWRVYACVICNTPTSWRFMAPDYSVPACSEECFAVLEDRHEASKVTSKVIISELSPEPSEAA